MFEEETVNEQVGILSTHMSGYCCLFDPPLMLRVEFVRSIRGSRVSIVWVEVQRDPALCSC